MNRSLQRDEETYELEKFKKNAMIIFNHENFWAGDRRLGTALDVAALERTFKQFRFDVTTYNDLTQANLFGKLEQFSKMNFNDYGCICVAILTHGQDGGFLRAYDTRYREREAFSCFDALANPTLVAKPVIFLIQACRGSTAAARVPYGRGQTFEFDADTSENSSRPTESDMIIFHSSFFGRASVRVVEEGSWFIQTLCEQLERHGSTDHLEELFLRVRQNVAAMEYNGVKQMPAVTTTLLKKLVVEEGSWFIQTLCEQLERHGSTDHLEELFLRVRQNVAAMEYNGVKQMPAVTTTLLKKLYLKKIDDTYKESTRAIEPCPVDERHFKNETFLDKLLKPNVVYMRTRYRLNL